MIMGVVQMVPDLCMFCYDIIITSSTIFQEGIS